MRGFKEGLEFNHSKRFVNLRDSRTRICVKSSVKKWNYLEFFGIFTAKKAIYQLTNDYELENLLDFDLRVCQRKIPVFT